MQNRWKIFLKKFKDDTLLLSIVFVDIQNILNVYLIRL